MKLDDDQLQITRAYFDLLMDRLSGTEIAAMWFGHLQVRQDLLGALRSGRRPVNDADDSIQIIARHTGHLEEALMRLAARDADKLNDVIEYLERSQVDDVTYLVHRLRNAIMRYN